MTVTSYTKINLMSPKPKRKSYFYATEFWQPVIELSVYLSLGITSLDILLDSYANIF